MSRSSLDDEIIDAGKIGPSSLPIANRSQGAMHFRDDFERAFALAVIENIGCYHHLIGAGLLDHVVQSAPNSFRAADDRTSEGIRQDGACIGIKPRFEILDGWRNPARPARPGVEARLLRRG